MGRAWEEMLIAEGSDWFWWYGDDHSSDQDLVFDELFRRHVRNIYRAIETPVPEELFASNISTRPPSSGIIAPTGFIRPVIDGELTNYFEWVGAGSVDVAPVGDAMHEVSGRTTAPPRAQIPASLEGHDAGTSSRVWSEQSAFQT